MLSRELLCQNRRHHAKKVICSCGRAMQQQQPTGLEVWERRDAIQQCLVIVLNLTQLDSHVTWVAQRNSKHTNPLLLRIPCASPDSRIGVGNNSHLLQLCATFWFHPSHVPHMSCALVDVDMCMSAQFLRHIGMYRGDSCRCRQGVDVVRKCKQNSHCPASSHALQPTLLDGRLRAREA